MTQQVINTGTVPNDGTGEGIQSGGNKINDNFTELYADVDALEVIVNNHIDEGGGALTALNINQTNPHADDVDNEPKAAKITATFDYNQWKETDEGGSDANTGFTNRELLRLTMTGTDGQNSNGGTPSTSAKTTWIPLNISAAYKGGGQHFGMAIGCDNFGMSDAFCMQLRNDFYTGPVNGDEGAGFTAVNYLRQCTNNGSTRLERVTISSVPAKATINTTFSANISGQNEPQTIQVADSSGVTAGQWIVAGQENPDGTTNLEAVEVISVPDATHIEGRFLLPHNSGQSIRAATPLILTNTNGVGQYRVLVNLTYGSPYTTGTAGVTGGGNTVVGTGTVWTSTMVGGDSTNVGAISLTNDDYSGSPFDSTGENSTLKCWYQIKTVSDNTHLTFHSFDVAGDTSYQGLQTTAAAYTIRPAMRILRIIEATNTIICEYSAHTWTAADSCEVVCCPYPDVTGLSFQTALYTPSGKYRAFMLLDNVGARRWDKGFWVRGENMKTGGNADTIACDQAFYAQDCDTGFFANNCDYGFDVTGCVFAAIRLGTGNNQGNAIVWDNSEVDLDVNAYIRGVTANEGLTFRMVTDGSSSTTLGAFVAIADDNNSLGHHSVKWWGVFQCSQWVNLGSYTVAGLPSASTAAAGAIAYCSNETGGAVLVFSDGTNWRRVTDRAVAS